MTKKCHRIMCPNDLPEVPVTVMYHGKAYKFCSHACALDIILEAIKDTEMMVKELLLTAVSK